MQIRERFSYIEILEIIYEHNKRGNNLFKELSKQVLFARGFHQEF